jgi:tricorn protease
MISVLSTAQAVEPAQDVLKRFPHASATAIVFVARGDLWSVAREGGNAHPLTRGGLRPVMPRFSPDGRWIAFSAFQAGRQNVYVIPAAGGEPKRLTYNSNDGRQQDDMVVTWTPDSANIVFGSQMGATSSKGYRMFTVALTGGLPKPMPMEHSGLLSFAPDSKRLAYVQTLNDFDNRKRYNGGAAQDIYTFNLQTHATSQITTWKGNDTSPMWHGRSVYFLSDRDGNRRMNLWRYDEVSGKSKQVTYYSDFDIDFPSLGGDTITFHQGGKLYAMHLPSEKVSEIQVAMPPDPSAGIQEIDASKFVRSRNATGNPTYGLAPDGSAVFVSARGDIFNAPVIGGKRINLTTSSRVDEENPAISPDGSTLAYVTDVGGEQQIAIRPAQGGPERIVTRFARGSLYTPVWAPDGSALAVADSDKRLWLVRMDSSEPKEVARDRHRLIVDAAFSPDSRWLAYSIQGENQHRAIHLHDIETHNDHVVSSPMNSDHHPVFSADGRYLYFVSARTVLPIASSSEEAFATVNADGVYVTTLRRHDRSAIATLSGPDQQAALVNAAVPRVAPMKIDVDGLMARTVNLPVKSGNFSALAIRAAKVFYMTQPIPLVGGELPGTEPALHVYDMHQGTDKVLVEGLDSFTISADGKIILYKQGGQWATVSSTGDKAPMPFALGAMPTKIDVRQEWKAMFDRVWRLDRDLYLSSTMNGIDWPAVRTAYFKFLPLLGSRDDLNYLIGQVQGELATSHMVFWGGDFGASAPPLASPRLGADYALDQATGHYRFARIYPGDNSRPALRSPLSQPGAEVHEGEFLLAVNGKPLLAPATPDSVLEGLEGDLELLVGGASGEPRRVIVTPVQEEFELREEFMIAENRRKVDRLSNGRVAYIYLADFEQRGAEQFVRQFYPQINKDALIVDIRANAGGFTSQQILERLKRQVVGMYANRQGGRETLPAQVFNGPMVTLINQLTGSDGDQFAYYFRQYGLGKVVGQRSWGGVRGVTRPLDLADGTRIVVPKDALYSPGSKWLIENVGTEPDVEVNNVPGESATGRDRQLESAVAILVRAIKTQPPALPALPPALPSYPSKGEVDGPKF